MARYTARISIVKGDIVEPGARTHRSGLRSRKVKEKFIYIALHTCDGRSLPSLSCQYQYQILRSFLLSHHHSVCNELQCSCMLDHFVSRADLVLICLQWILLSLDVFFYPIFVGVASVLYIKTLIIHSDCEFEVWHAFVRHWPIGP